MEALKTITSIIGALAVLFLANTSVAEIGHVDKSLKERSTNQSQEKRIYAPSRTGQIIAVGYISGSNVKFGVNFEDHSDYSAFKALPEATNDDNVELKAGFTYTTPANPKTKFYLNYSMLGATDHPVAQDKSSDQDYYLDQQAKMGVKIEF